VKRNKRIEREQGDVNTTVNRREYWKRNLKGESKRWFDEDKKYFLHQSLSTPVLNVLSRAQGVYIEDLTGKKYIDMHGNGVHNAGFNNPAVVEAVKKQLEEHMTFAPAAIRIFRPLSWPKSSRKLRPVDYAVPFSAREDRKPSRWP
jgi:4-aminobutyrate aminotransferase